ncbi:MAG: hypothetical protein IJN38_00565 [Clostridia bacterium]|nr:hypothetical protein [Clostridia bacterium]
MTRKLKRIAALVLALAILASSFALSAFAAGTATGNEAMNVGLALSADTAEPGDEITVTVSISNNYNATTMRWPVLYSTDVFELVDGSLTTAIDSVTTVAGSTTTTTNEEFVPADYSEGYSAFTIQWIANSDGTTIGAFNSATSVACFSFKLKVIEGSEGKTGTVLIPQSSEHFYKMAVSDIADATSFYTAPVTFTVSDAAALTVESAYVAPELVALGDTIIDKANGFIYGLTHGDFAEIVDIVEDGYAKVEGDGSVVCTPVAGQDVLGTGAKVELVDSLGVTVETYYIVIFGDTDGDSFVTTDDIIDASRWYAYLDSANDYEDFSNPVAFAMDINGDDFVDDVDFAIVERYYAYLIEDVPQTR